jgi:hypothetical protein
VAETLLAGITELDAGGDVNQRLERALEALGPIRFSTTKQEPAMAILRTAPEATALNLFDRLDDEDLATALDLALGSLPPGYWAIPSLIARLMHMGRSRRPVGPDLVAVTTLPDVGMR